MSKRDASGRLVRAGGVLVAAAVVAASAQSASAGARIYVDQDAVGANNGSSWANAYVDLQDALAAATLNDEIWVAEGVYRPDGGTGDRNDFFSLPTNVQIYGGFEGDELFLFQRNIAANVTVLSGDIGVAGVDTDNSYNVVFKAGGGVDSRLDGFVIERGRADGNPLFLRDRGAGMILLDNAVLTVAFCVIADNFATGPEVQSGAAGVYVGPGAEVAFEGTLITDNTAGGFTGAGGVGVSSDAFASFDTCVLSFNQAGAVGGGLAVAEGGEVTVINTVFGANTAGSGGGGAALFGDDSPNIRQRFANVVFNGNEAVVGAGAVVVENTETVFINCTLVHNVSLFGTAGIGVNPSGGTAEVEVVNSILRFNTGAFSPALDQINNPNGTPLSVNYTNIVGATTFGGVGNIDLPAGFVDRDGADDIPGTPDDNLALIQNSYSIDMGSNPEVPALITTDILGNPRFSDDATLCDLGVGPAPVVDMGAFEFQGDSVNTCGADVTFDGAIDLNDLNLVLSVFGQVDLRVGDTNGDCVVDLADLNLVLALFGTPCP